ncbi:unnamed protein product [Rotaria socialis]|uniref:Uncharacterized protein n=1 Tax=Rotaria socialis TaxID=392032 RepID=A0A818SZX5_9BILA|nr:unnamed protein product [Rotaria socialis]
MKHFIGNQIDENDYYFSLYVYLLMIGRVINVNLSQFSNIRCLKLECPLKKVLAQLNSNISTHLKHVFISNLGLFEIIDEWTCLS